VLETDVQGPTGAIRLIDFMPPGAWSRRSTRSGVTCCANGLVERYRADDENVHVDGLPPGEGVFLPCSFWLAQNLALQGRRAEARALFERLLALRNDLGLIAKEYDPERRRLVGNVPQAFTHLTLVDTATLLARGEAMRSVDA
jgi:GH15 family glucan-1,4-alpha-glucosidase